MAGIELSQAQIYAAARSTNLQQSQLVEVIFQGVSGGSQQTVATFPDQPNLRYVFLSRLRVYTADILPTSPISNTPLISAAQLNSCFLTLYANQKNALDLHPAIEFQTVDNHTDNFKWSDRIFNSHVVTWQKSKVTLSTAFANTTNLSVLFCVEFIDPANLITPETQLTFANMAG